MTVKNDDISPEHGIACSRGSDYNAFFDDMFRFITSNNTRHRSFHFVPSGFTPAISDALLKIMFENPDYVLQARVRQTVADWDWMQGGVEACCRIVVPILNPYQGLLTAKNSKNYLYFFAKVCEAWKTLLDIGKPHLVSYVESYALKLMSNNISSHPTEHQLDSAACDILRIRLT